MKYFFSLFIFLSLCFNQTNNELLELTYKQCHDPDYLKTLKGAKKEIKSYESKTHGKFEIGQKLIIGKALEGNFETQQNTGFFASSTSQIASFSTIIHGKMAGGVLMGMNYLDADTQSEEVTIIKMYAMKKSGKKTAPRYISVYMKNDAGGGSLVSGRTVLDLEKALSIKEIINPNAPLTREEAIAKLKESKDLLDLELITQDEYNKLKNDLTPIIRGN